MVERISVGIIDDHKLFRSGVEDIVNDTSQFKIVLSVGTSSELYEGLNKKSIQILLLDINLKEESGLDVLVKLNETRPEVKVIMLTMHNEASVIKMMVQKGAHGYLLKDTTPEELIMTLQKVCENGKYYDSYTTNILVDSLQNKEKLASMGIGLTDLEVELLTYISEGLTAEEVSAKFFKSTRTIEGYRQKLMEKISAKNIAELVSWGFKNKIL